MQLNTLITGQTKTERLDRLYLLAHLLKQPTSFVLAHLDDALPANLAEKWQSWLERYQQGEPIAYITGQKSFWLHTFNVTPDVLIPRPETEHLIEWVLANRQAPDQSILELGTGSGCIAISLALEKPNWQISACDISSAALAVAKANGAKHRAQVNWLESNWFSNITGQFDIIISNPPYIANNDPHLSQLQYEPQQALVADQAGLADIQHLLQQAPTFLAKNSVLLIEHGAMQANAIQKFAKTLSYQGCTTHQDLAGLDRFTVLEKAKAPI